MAEPHQLGRSAVSSSKGFPSSFMVQASSSVLYYPQAASGCQVLNSSPCHINTCFHSLSLLEGGLDFPSILQMRLRRRREVR